MSAALHLVFALILFVNVDLFVVAPDTFGAVCIALTVGMWAFTAGRLS